MGRTTTERRGYINALRAIEEGVERLKWAAEELRAKVEDAEIAEVRTEARAWAREVLADPDTVVFDSETTGLHGAVDFVEVAVINAQGEALFNSRVRPAPSERYPYDPIEIETGAFEVHGISEEMLKGEPTLSEVWPQLKKALDGRRLVIYNSAYDAPILAEAAKRYGLEAPELKATECAMNAYAKYVADWSNYRGGWTWQRLPNGTHSALADCRATLEVIRQMAAETPDEARERSAAEELQKRHEKLRAEGVEDEAERQKIIRDEDMEDWEDIPF